ncbi:MAG: alginate export family protein [Syntrophales bacterium]
MKKLFAALLVLGLIVAVSGTASAVDVKFGGSYYVVGVYDSNPNVREDSYSRAFFFQQFRLQPVFNIAEGLTFTARMDAMEKQWGNNNWAAGLNNGDITLSRPQTSATTAKIQENIEFERGYVNFNTGIGAFQVGYQVAGVWGTVFGDSTVTRPRIKMTTKAGPLVIVALYEKYTETTNNTLIPTAGLTDAEGDGYVLALLYPFKGGQAGILNVFQNKADGRVSPANPNRAKLYLFEPMVKATFGPVYFEAEVDYMIGKAAEFEAPSAAADLDMRSLAAYAMLKTSMGPATFGAQVGYAKGDSDALDDKKEDALGGGQDWNPALILMSNDMNTWSMGGVNTANPTKNNMILINAFGSYKLTPKLELGAAITYAKKDKVAAGWDKDMGTEFDATATYKLYDNLTYMVGAGYLFAGDYFKSGVAAAKVDNDYILMNKLTLNF